jgi:hypothetical protein
MYLGASSCIKVTEHDILNILYDVMGASNSFAMQQSHWALNRDGEICSWNGVECDDNDIIQSISFPLLGLNAEP